jgi:hypothetical protein
MRARTQRRRYILGAENLTLANLQKLAASRKKAPALRLPYAVAYGLGVCSTAWAGVTGKPPRVDARSVWRRRNVGHARRGESASNPDRPRRRWLCRCLVYPAGHVPGAALGVVLAMPQLRDEDIDGSRPSMEFPGILAHS